MKKFSVKAVGKDGRTFAMPVVEAKSVRLAKYSFSDAFRKQLNFFSKWKVERNN
ncbi:hypothetical protein [Chryseobacterium sp. MYb328]|uniref:hypothetical protein n=1 Tax=Chryseobacterium sp. MYb328 TaxID=2745231 RepID=UPI00309FCA36